MSDSPWTPLGPKIAVMDGDPVRMLGIPFRTRMTIVELTGGGLWIHSPVAPDDSRCQAVSERGTVRHLVAPGTFHHLHVGAWQTRYPEATTWAAPGLPSRYPERCFDRELTDVAPADWRDDIEQVVFLGSKVMLEVVFFHRPSRTLLITDIVQNHEPAADSWFWRAVKRLNNVAAPHGGVPRDWRLTVRDRDPARRARDRMLSWPFEQVVLTHGRCITERAHERIEQAFAWLG